MSEKTAFMLKYGKEGDHYNFDDVFNKELSKITHPRDFSDSYMTWSSLGKNPSLKEHHVTSMITKVESPGLYSGGDRFLRHARDSGVLKAHHIETIFDNLKHKNDITDYPYQLSDRASHAVFDSGDIYAKVTAVRRNASVARKVLDDISSSDNPDFRHPGSVWVEALRNRDAVTPADIELAKKSGHSKIAHLARTGTT